MNHILEMSNDSVEYMQEYVFKPIAEGNSILFLGAGASIGEKKYLSEHIMGYYADKIGVEIDTNDLIEFVDIISANPKFERSDFDSFIVDLLHKLNVTESHRILARMNWREIITTNCDLIIERTKDSLVVEDKENLKIIPIRIHRDYNYRPADDEVKYVKLNGCISDIKKYPLIFSTDDFKNANRYYKEVLKSLENLSSRIIFISIGYSFSDPFAKSLLKKFDSFNFRDRKWIINVDPFAKDSQLPYFTENRISIIRLTFEEFIFKYSEWEQKGYKAKAERIKTKFSNRNDQTISIPSHLKVRLSSSLVQLHRSNIFPYVDAINFYRGQEPTYHTIRQNHDVVRGKLLENIILNIRKLFTDKHDLVLSPINSFTMS